MLHVTQDALEYMAAILDDAVPGGQKVLRVAQRGGKVALSFDEPIPADVTFQHKGRTVLVIDRKFCETKISLTLSIQQTENGVVLCIR